MKIIYKIKNNLLLINCDIKEYDELIIKRMSMFDNKKYEAGDTYTNYINISKKETKYCINQNTFIIKGKLIHTDLYQLINNIVSNMINDQLNVYIHSCVVKKDNKAFLLLGDFESGKTTLAIESIKKGYKILSADQSWICNKDNHLYLHLGSKYLSFNDSETLLDPIEDDIKIDYIFELKGLCYNGDVELSKEKNNTHLIKRISKYCTWSISNVLFTDQSKLDIDLKMIYSFTKSIDMPLYSIRGDCMGIIKKMEELL